MGRDRVDHLKELLRVGRITLWQQQSSDETEATAGDLRLVPDDRVTLAFLDEACVAVGRAQDFVLDGNFLSS